MAEELREPAFSAEEVDFLAFREVGMDWYS